MARRKNTSGDQPGLVPLVPPLPSRRRSGLFLSRFLAEEADKVIYRGKDQDAADEGPTPAMRTSAERKRFGIYYTPPDFTAFIVDRTLRAVVDDRFAAVRERHVLEAGQTESDEPSPELAAFWRDWLAELRGVKVCDPACGGGALLIQAYDVLDRYYLKIADQLLVHEGGDAEPLHHQTADIILADNLYGVDVSEQAVEITQLALWIRSARRGRTLADLSHNVVHGNSLVTDSAVHAQAMRWEAKFAEVFSRPGDPGFDCVIGNPPWERMKLQEREFFAFSAPKIANAVSAAQRRQLIERLKESNPALYETYRQAQDRAERTLAHVRQSGDFPLMSTETTERLRLCLLANLNACALDYVARQKIGGVTLNFFIVQQFPMFPPDRYAERCPWAKRQTLERWISDRVLKLTCTADDVRPPASTRRYTNGTRRSVRN